ncbi:FliM/FliN family flagellar motor switch protein [Enterovibrio norvegicus]|uniref:FliM/FliN family flagellar motor switch protein n=1 Tax=Enterovibrio norvegicus TaxID=188144 RepID=A0ABV4L7B0_9GAMM|nr:FliM/FliN family flagellar motor C-terminal domain-containing protein [Enterovibrio norvegicus]OEF55561.1 hypothetical protein A1OU_24710 [Enterovibrio norvegicus]
MEKETLQLGNDLVASFFTEALKALLSFDTKGDSQCKAKKGESARTQRYALFHDGRLRSGINVYFNSAFVKALFDRYFPQSVVEIHDVEHPFIQSVIAEYIDDWLRGISLLKDSSSDENVEYYFVQDEYQIALSIPKDIEVFILEHHLKLETKKRLSTQKATEVLRNQSVDLALTLPKIKMSLEDVMNLKQGDRIRSERKIDAGLSLNVDEHTVVRNVFISYKDEKASIVVGNI